MCTSRISAIRYKHTFLFLRHVVNIPTSTYAKNDNNVVKAKAIHVEYDEPNTQQITMEISNKEQEKTYDNDEQDDNNDEQDKLRMEAFTVGTDISISDYFIEIVILILLLLVLWKHRNDIKIIINKMIRSF